MARKRLSGRQVLLLLGFGLLVGAVLFEGVCQLVSISVYNNWAFFRGRPNHFYQPSNDFRLTYDLKRNYFFEEEKKALYTNTYGFREKTDDRSLDIRRIVVFGDSVTFGTGLDQTETIPAHLQQMLDPTSRQTRVINAGVPGYGLREMPALLQQAYGAYRQKQAIYILNLNDFSLRDTVYEGADNGLYKMYNAPLIKSPWFVRKAIYRLVKGNDVDTDLGWYRWLYRGTRERNLASFADLAQFARSQKMALAVVIMPSVHAYSADGKTYALDDILTDLKSWMDAEGIKWFDPRDAFLPDPAKYIDGTDHFFSGEGCRKMAEYLRDTVVPALDGLTPTAAASAH